MASPTTLVDTSDVAISAGNHLPVTGFELTVTDVVVTASALPTGAATQTTLAAILASIGAAGDAVGANTVIGQLKQIAANTAA